jgi:hypothetical protein
MYLAVFIFVIWSIIWFIVQEMPGKQEKYMQDFLKFLFILIYRKMDNFFSTKF